MSNAPLASPARPQALVRWLSVIAALIVAMVVVGGITRLTESGLSITEWKPVTGAIPPLTEAQWAAEFDRYRHSSQYALMNRGMSLAAFKHIFFWEYFHRLLGRIIGLAYALPMLWFLARRAVPSGYAGRLILLLLLGGAQGGIGWLMVKSGLTDRVNVEPAMLAAHLLTALVLLSAIVWTACDLQALARGGAGQRRARPTPLALLALALLFAQLFLGAITAGLRAGYVSNSWPLMNGRLVPAGIRWWGDFWMTMTSDPYLVYFLHRWWAWLAALVLVRLALRTRQAGGTVSAYALLALLTLQILLGIATVLSGIALPLAVLHQGVGALLLVAAVAAAHRLGRNPRHGAGGFARMGGRA